MTIDPGRYGHPLASPEESGGIEKIAEDPFFIVQQEEAGARMQSNRNTDVDTEEEKKKKEAERHYELIMLYEEARRLAEEIAALRARENELQKQKTEISTTITFLEQQELENGTAILILDQKLDQAAQKLGLSEITLERQHDLSQKQLTDLLEKEQPRGIITVMEVIDTASTSFGINRLVSFDAKTNSYHFTGVDRLRHDITDTAILADIAEQIRSGKTDAGQGNRREVESYNLKAAEAIAATLEDEHLYSIVEREREQYQAARQSLDAAKEKLQKIKTDLEEQRNELKKVESEIAGTQKEIAAKEHRLEKINGRIRELGGQVLTKGREVQEAQQALLRESEEWQKAQEEYRDAQQETGEIKTLDLKPKYNATEAVIGQHTAEIAARIVREHGGYISDDDLKIMAADYGITDLESLKRKLDEPGLTIGSAFTPASPQASGEVAFVPSGAEAVEYGASDSISFKSSMLAFNSAANQPPSNTLSPAPAPEARVQPAAQRFTPVG